MLCSQLQEKLWKLRNTSKASQFKTPINCNQEIQQAEMINNIIISTSKNLSKKPNFYIDAHIGTVCYDATVDKHLQYYFSRKNNRSILRKNKIINRKGQIVDQGLSRMIKSGQLTISNNFRMKKKRLKVCQGIKGANKSYSTNLTMKNTIDSIEFKRYLIDKKQSLNDQIERNRKQALQNNSHTNEVFQIVGSKMEQRGKLLENILSKKRKKWQ